MVIFQSLLRRFWIQIWFCNYQPYFCLFHNVFEYTPGKHDQGMMLVLPNQLLYWVLSTSDQCFVSFQPILCHPHIQMRIIFFQGVRISIPNLETFSQPCFNWIFLNCLSHDSPAKGWPYRFRSRGTTGSSILDHDLGHLCRGRRIQMSGHSYLRIFNNFRASSIFTWVLAGTASAACPADPGSLDMISMTFAAVICDADDPWTVNTAYDPESSFTKSPRSTTRPLYFWCFASDSAFFKWQMSSSEPRWTFLPFVLTSSITSFLLLTFVRSQAGIFSNFSHTFACDLRAPHWLTRPVFEAHPGATTFPHEANSLWSHLSTGPSASRNTFSVSTITDGNPRIGGPQHLSCPCVGLTAHWAVSVRKCTTGRWPSR